MRTPSLRHLTDETLLRDLNALVAHDRTTTVALVAHLSEVDLRRLYRPRGFSSMFQYCIRELGMSEDVAWRRIIAARLARRFPRIFPALADGRLHVSGVALLKDYLTQGNADDLLAAIEHKSRREIGLILAERFPKPDVPTRVRAIVAAATTASAPTQTPGNSCSEHPSGSESERLLGTQDATPDPNSQNLPAPVRVNVTMPEQLAAPAGTIAVRPKLTPLSPERFALQVTIDWRRTTPCATHRS